MTKKSSWLENPGHCPDKAKGKKVLVLYRKRGDDGKRHYSKTPVPADGKGAIRWSLSMPARSPEGASFDVVAYKIAE